MRVTAHCIIKNEEVFIEAAILSVLTLVETVLVFDTGSTDKTVSIVRNLLQQYPDRIIFEEKGPCDKVRHTALRQEMVERTQTEWFMILDGDEVWSERGICEAKTLLFRKDIECIMAPFYLCVGDVYHAYKKAGEIEMLGKKDFWYPRIIRKTRGVHWVGDYNEDTLRDDGKNIFFTEKNSATLSARYWHMTHLRRSSSDDAEYSSGGTRKEKRRETYIWIGKTISEEVPPVLGSFPRLSFVSSILGFFRLIFWYAGSRR